ncbi:unnamed protein product [Durusdinium trenchii]|uniref:Uncharacterized protein n=1 Tax=Durusdinium trenchii TaxID=1381693 RepID=A0ABP0Q2B6_9DINO
MMPRSPCGTWQDDADLEEEAGVILDEAQLNEDDPDFEPIEENGEEDAADQLEPPFEENENGEEDKAADVADVADAEFEAPLQENGEEDPSRGEMDLDI